MGMLIDGVWHDVWYDTKESGGRFQRQASRFRNWVTPDGAPGPSGIGGFKAEAGRYHLYVSLACPWAHRTLIFRSLKQLTDLIGVSVVSPLMLEKGWTFGHYPGATEDALFGANALSEIYLKAEPGMTGRVTVPVLFDKQTGTIVSNESAEIIRMFNSAFDGLTGNCLNFYPDDQGSEIDALNGLVYDRVNNGVYKAGFATTQEAYEENVTVLFHMLDMLDSRLAHSRYLFDERLTEADWRLFTTLIRFDAVYFGHFKCNLRRIEDYEHLPAYLRDLYQEPGVRETVNFDHIKTHYYRSHKTINPTGVVPLGPILDFEGPHRRGALARAA